MLAKERSFLFALKIEMHGLALLNEKHLACVLQANIA